jgi:hypothetical protein
MTRWIGTVLFAATATMASATMATGQGAMNHDADAKVKQTGPVPDGWSMMFDSKNAKPTDVDFVTMGSGMHVTAGPAATYFNPANRASGAYTITASFGVLTAPMHDAYGIVWNGDNFGTPEASYLYFIVRGDGKFMVKHRANSTLVHTIMDWTDNAAVKKATETGQASNALEVRVSADSTRLVVNGTQVAAFADKTMGSTKGGTYGFRVNHNINTHISNFGKK